MWSFGIVTDGKNSTQLSRLLSSIHSQNIPDYEVIICGGLPHNEGEFPIHNNVKWILFDETQKPGWITKKKNIIVQNAKHDDICLLHDYYLLHDDWKRGWHIYDAEAEDWEVATNVIHTLEGLRHSDWTIDPWVMGSFLQHNPGIVHYLKSKFPNDNPQYIVGLPYLYRGLEKFQYLSGGYFCGKKQFLLNNPQLEDKLWGQSEDVLWSQKVRQKTKFKFNNQSTVSVQKPNKWNTKEMPEPVLEIFKTWTQLIGS